MPPTRFAIATIAMLVATTASARTNCTINLEPLVSVLYFRTVADDATTAAISSRGAILVSKGGAVTMMRTERKNGSEGAKIFVSGQLRQSQLQALRVAVRAARATNPSGFCLVESTPDPPTGLSVFGGTEFTVYRGAFPPLRFNVQRSDPSGGPVPHCDAALEALDSLFFTIADSMREGVPPLECLPSPEQ